MKSKWIAVVVVIVIIGLLVASFALRFATRRSQEPAKSIDEIQAEEGIPVDAVRVQRGTIKRYLEILGNVQGIEQVNITSSLPIDIAGIAKRAGDRVKKGDVIIELARDRQGNAYHQFEMARQALENARLDLERMENLYDAGAVSGQSLEQARLAYRNAKSQFDQAASVVDLVSPIDGVVTMVSATEGSTAEPGVPLATVASIDRMRVRCYVGQMEVAQLQVGQRALIQTSTTPSGAPTGRISSVEGEITRVSLSSDPATKLFLIEITADNKDGILRPGVVATVSVLVDEKPDVILVPLDSILERRGKNYVFRVASDRAVLSEIEMGTADSDNVEVFEGVAEGDTVVVRGQFRLTDGARVRIRSVEGTE
ncbi:MAG: efflux RND transporter periplasmic adaptor subunit [bacterium]